jgi:hypothetical protein
MCAQLAKIVGGMRLVRRGFPRPPKLRPIIRMSPSALGKDNAPSPT